LNIGIIGGGGIANKLHLPQIAEVDGLKVTHIAGTQESRLKILAERFGIPHIVGDYDAVLADDSVEGIIIALPHPLHVPFGLKALAAGKHVLMQKPLCADMGEANAFVEAAEASDKIVMCLPHFAPEIYKTRELIEAGKIGTPSGAHCRTSHGGPEVYYAEVRDAFGEKDEGLWFFQAGEAAVGALFDMGVYAVASLVSVMGRVQSVMGQVATIDKPTTLEDTATLILHFANGAVGTAETGWCDPARTWQFRVHGTKGKITVPGENSSAMTLWEPANYTREDEPPLQTPIDASDADRGNAHAHWFKCIQEGRQPERSHARAARHVTEVLLAGLQSSRTGQRVTIHSDPE
jgi:predicted dehydrogenase